jgi:hypothetical protein
VRPAAHILHASGPKSTCRRVSAALTHNRRAGAEATWGPVRATVPLIPIKCLGQRSQPDCHALLTWYTVSRPCGTSTISPRTHFSASIAVSTLVPRDSGAEHSLRQNYRSGSLKHDGKYDNRVQKYRILGALVSRDDLTCLV